MLKKLIWTLTGGFLVTFALAVPSADRGAQLRPPVPIEPIGGIVDAFRDHDVVGLSAGEGHGDVRGTEFVVALIRDPRFAAANVDVVMENGNARHQDLIDRYIHGEDVPHAELRRVWDDTTQPQVINPVGEIPPVYRDLRMVNATLPPARHHRAVLGDPPIDWSAVRSRDDFQKWLAQRDSSGAEMIQEQILARGRKALAVYGGGHLQRRQQATNYKMEHPLAQTVISLLDRAGVKTFVVVTVGERDAVASWPVPGYATIRGTELGAEIIPPGSLPRIEVKPDGSLAPIPRDRWIDLRAEEQIDALLYLGPRSTLREPELPRTLCTDPGYLENRLQRMAIAGLPPPEFDRLKKFCGR